MPDDREISELISQSVRGKLSQEDEQKLAESIAQNEESRKYDALSKRIHQSVAGLKPTDESDNSVSLSNESRRQLSESVQLAMQEKLSMSQAGLISDVAFDPNVDTVTYNSETASEHKDVVVRFHLTRKLAAGGIGEVWVARDEKLGRNVVIKELNAVAKESVSAWGRFQREAEITGLLEHPNIVPLYVFGTDRRTAEPFYAMRFVGRRTLADSIEEHHDRVKANQADELSLHRLLNVFLDVCQAIAYAHSRGVIHRDLKPDNVAIDNFGQVIVLDWGLAKVLEDSELAIKLNDNCNLSESSLVHTAYGEVVGTPVYMSPEQASGQIDSIDKRTDVYGLGAILFSILTGKAPHFHSVSKADAGFTEVVKQIANAPTPKPGDFANVPNDLEAICIRALSRKQHLRYDSVGDFSEAVEKWMAGQGSKKIAYQTLRMEGRELLADMQNRVHDLERNVSFCSGLPPVQELIKAESEDDEQVWQKRMSTILVGLMDANPSYQKLVYGRFEDGNYTEIVRVEKQNGPSRSVRTTPRSRLETRQKGDYLQKLSERLPGELLTSIVCNQALAGGCDELSLQSGIPIYDHVTEEIFGFVLATCDLQQLLQQQLSSRFTASEVIVACDTFNILSRSVGGQITQESRGETVDDTTPAFSVAVDHLQTNLDYVDEVTSEIYGARIWFDQNKNGLMYLLKR